MRVILIRYSSLIVTTRLLISKVLGHDRHFFKNLINPVAMLIDTGNYYPYDGAKLP